MPTRFLLFTFTLATGLMPMTGNVALAESTSSYFLAAGTDADNTGRNVRDRDDATVTPEDQGESASDRKITAAIRRSIVKDKSLSLDAHNAKIITRNGVVTLRGPVDSQAEKQKLQSIAEKVRGVKRIDNQLEIKSP